MKKIKYQGGITKLIATRISRGNKAEFAFFIKENLYTLRHRYKNNLVQLAVVSFSSCNDFNEQILSILSFLRYVGTPVAWTLYSDGTHTSEQIQLLTSSFEFIQVKGTDLEDIDSVMKNCKKELHPYLEQLLHYAGQHPLGKRLYLYLNHDIKEPTLFLDADILFYNQASIIKIILKEDVNGWYLPDTDWGCLDSHYKASNIKQLYQVNGGFLLFNKPLSHLTEGLEFLKQLDYKYEYFSEQTIMHILLKANSFMPLDPRIFILNIDDQFDFSYLLPREKMAIRHYTGPVRHKMWQRNWKWQLSLSESTNG